MKLSQNNSLFDPNWRDHQFIITEKELALFLRYSKEHEIPAMEIYERVHTRPYKKEAI